MLYTSICNAYARPPSTGLMGTEIDINTGIASKAPLGTRSRVVVFLSDRLAENKKSWSQLVGALVSGAWSDFKTTNSSFSGKAAKFGAGVVAGDTVAKLFEALTPVQWALCGFGPIPAEFTKSGAIQVFEFTAAQRLGSVDSWVSPREGIERTRCRGSGVSG